MPSVLPVPTVEELRTAFATGILGDRDDKADVRLGAIYDVLGGVGALVFRRLALRDRDIARASYFDFSEGESLARIALQRFATSVIEEAPGTGTVRFARPTVAGGGGTLRRGTRITLVARTSGQPLTYELTEDTTVGLASSVSVGIRSLLVGTGVAVNTAFQPGWSARIEDTLWDPSWQVVEVTCSPGRSRETDHGCRARIKKERADTRVGYAKSITDACKAAGAEEVALFASDFLGTNPSSLIETIGDIDVDGYGDVGLNRIFVADASFTSRPELLRACRVAVDHVAICGTSPQVFGMEPVLVTITATVKLWQSPARFLLPQKRTDCVAAIVNYFETRQNPFYFRVAGIRGAILEAVRDVHLIELETHYTLPDDTVGTEPTLPSVLAKVPISRFFATPQSITVTITGP